MAIDLPKLKCMRCRHEWYLNKPVTPKVCPKCKSPYWNTPRKTQVNGEAEEKKA